MFILFCGYITNAQIKVVGDDYKDSLSGAKNTYSFDLDFDALFPYINTKELYGWIGKYMLMYRNMMGDTIWIPYTYSYSTDRYERICFFEQMNMPNIQVAKHGFAIATDSTGREHVEYYPPAGYYEISGYVFCQENASRLFDNYFKELDNPFLINTWSESLPIQMIWPYVGEKNKKSTKALKDRILEGGTDVSDFLFYIKLSSLNDINGYRYDYYVNLIWYPQLCFFNLKFYNTIKNHFLGKKICFLGMASEGDQLYLEVNKDVSKDGFEYEKMDKRIIIDAITGENVKLRDSIYRVKDVVVKVKEYDGVDLYCILEGDTTGTFGINIAKVQYKYSIEGYDGNRHKDYELEDNSDEITHISFSKTYYDYPYLIQEKSKYALVCIDDLSKVFKDVADSLCTKKENDMASKKTEERARLQREREYKHKQAEQERKQIAYRQNIVNKYGQKFGTLINSHQIAIEMTKEMVKDAWGKPMNTYRTTTKYGQSEVWCYNYKTRVYFYNGKVVQIDD